MKAKLIELLKSINGNIGPDYYARMQYGKVVIQRRPKRTKPPTEAQLRARKALRRNTRGSISASSLLSGTTMKITCAAINNPAALK